MQCVILAAGRGTRMYPLTENTPKPLIKVCNKPILKHIVEALPSEIEEIIFVVNYLEEQIRTYCGEEFCGKKVKYVRQNNPVGGTGDALNCAKSLIKGRFLFMYADDIHGSKALKEVVYYPYAMLSAYSSTPQDFGVLEVDENNILKSIHEKPKNPVSNLINIGGFVLDKKIFDYEVKKSANGEVYVTDMVTAFAQDYDIHVVKQKLWLPIGKPEDIKTAEKYLCTVGGLY